MKLKWQLTRAFFLSLLMLGGFGLIAVLVSDHKIKRFDQALTNFVSGFESPGMTVVMKTFTFIGSAWVVVPLVVLIAILLHKMLKHRAELIFLLIVIAGSVLLNEALKFIFHRVRPAVHRMVSAAGYSFPSGHSMSAFTLYGVLAFLIWRHVPTAYGRVLVIIASAAMILMIGSSRIYLGVHYPSDVLGGYLMSGAWLAASIWFYQRYKERRGRFK